MPTLCTRVSKAVFNGIDVAFLLDENSLQIPRCGFSLPDRR